MSLQINFLVENKTKVSKNLSMSKKDFLALSNKSENRNTVSVKTLSGTLNSASITEYDGNSQSSSVKINLKSKYVAPKDEFDDSETPLSEDESDFDSRLNSLSEDRSDIEKTKLSHNLAIKSRRLRGGHNPNDYDYDIDRKSKKRLKASMTQDEIVKKNELILKRREEIKQKQENEKKRAIDKILNDEGRKLRERQRKLNEEKIKKEKEEENKLVTLQNSIKTIYKGDKITVSFPKNISLPKVLCQKSKENSDNKLSFIEVNNKYRLNKYIIESASNKKDLLGRKRLLV